jgi:hypothetical protein
VADTKISALTAVATPAVADEFAVNQAGTSKKVTLGQILNQRVYDAKAYGAVFDGSTNDAAAIQSAMDAAGAAGGGVVLLPAGTANLGTTSLEFKHSEVQVVGQGKNITILLYTGSSGAFRNSDEATPSIRTYCGVHELTINFSGATSGASALRIMALRQFQATNLYLFSSSTGGGSTWYGIHFIGENGSETYFGEFINVDIALTGAAGTQWCVYMGGDGWVNRHTFQGGVWEGNNANAVGIQPTSLTSDTNLFTGIGFQTHGATIVQLGGAGADANDNIFVGNRFEVGVGSSTITFSTASGVAQRNFFAGNYTSNTSFSDPLENGGNTIMGQLDWKLDLYNGSDPSRSIWLRGYQSGLTIGRSDGASGVLTLGETNFATSPASNFIQVMAEDVSGTTKLRSRDSSGVEYPLGQVERTITFVIDGGGSVIATGVKGYIEAPFSGTLLSATLLADVSGSAVVDIWKDTYANYPPVDADSITSSTPPTLSSAIKSQNTTLTSWTTSLTKGDILGFNVDSATTVTKLTVSLRYLEIAS